MSEPAPNSPAEPRGPAEPPGANPPNLPGAARGRPAPAFDVVVRRGAPQGPSTSVLASGRARALLALCVLVVVLQGAFAIIRRPARPASPPTPHQAPPPEVSRRLQESPVVKEYEPAAQAGDVAAMLILGEHYADVDQITLAVDLPAASRWLERAATADDAPAESAKAKVWLFELHQTCCPAEALAWLEEAAAAEDSRALQILRDRARDGTAEGLDVLVSRLDLLAAQLEARLEEHAALFEDYARRLAEEGGMDVSGHPSFFHVHDQLRAQLLPAARVAELVAAAQDGDAEARELLLQELGARETVVQRANQLVNGARGNIEAALEAARRGRENR